MNKAGLTIVVDWDDKKVRAGIEDLKKMFSATGQAFAASSGGKSNPFTPVEEGAKRTKDGLAKLKAEISAIKAEMTLLAANGQQGSAAFDALSSKLAVLNGNLEAGQRAVKASVGPYAELQQKANFLTRQANDLGAALGTESKAFREMSAEAKKATDQLKAIEAASGRNFRNVGNYASGYNGLSVSMSRILSELPNAAISSRIFFQSISNNFQPLKESIDDVIRKNKELAAQGLPTKSAFSQVASSLFSLNTLFLAGVAVLTAYGPKMMDWISSLRDSGKALINTKKEQEELNKAQEDAFKQAGAVIGKLEALNGVLKSNTANATAKKGAYDQLIKQYPSYAKQLHDEYVRTGNVANTIKNVLVPAIIAAARARAYQARIDDLAGKSVLKGDELTKALKEQGVTGQKYYSLASVEAKKLGITVEELLERNKQLFRAGGRPSKSFGLWQDFDAATFAAKNLQLELNALEGGISSYQDLIGKVTPAMGNISSQFEDTGKHVDKTTAKVSDAKKAAEEYQSSIDALEAKIKNGLISPHDEAIEKVKILSKYFEKLTGDLHRPLNSPLVQKILKDLKEAERKLMDFNAEMRRLDPELSKRTSQSIGEMLEQWREPLPEDKIKSLQKAIQFDPSKGLNGAKVPTPIADYLKANKEAAKKESDETKKLLDDYKNMVGNGISRGVDAVFSGLEDVLSGKGDIGDMFKGIGTTIADAMISFGKQMILTSKLVKKLKDSLSNLFSNPEAGTAAGIGLLAGGFALKAALTKKANKTFAFADGAVVYGPTQALIGEYAGASNNPEIVAPLNKLKDIIGNGGEEYTFTFKKAVSGEDIDLILTRHKSKIRR